MGILDFLKPKFREVTFNHSDGFRGFKRIPLVNYNDKDSEKGIKALKKKSFNFRSVTIREFVYEDRRAFSVYVDGCKIGTFFVNTKEDERILNTVLNGEISSVHVKIEYSGEFNDRYYAILYIGDNHAKR